MRYCYFGVAPINCSDSDFRLVRSGKQVAQRAFMHFLLTCKNKDDSIKNEGAIVVTTFSPLYVCGNFSRRSRAANSAVHTPIWPNFELVRDVTVVLITCKNEEDLIENEEPRVFTTLYINFSDAQGQVTPEILYLIHVMTS